MKNEIIGQERLLFRFQQMIDLDTYPRFSIIAGNKGSGKKLIARMLCKAISDGLYEECGTKIDDVRELIKDAYKVHSTAVYLIPDADNMSNAAKNALLKVTEEPPNNSFFIMTLEDAKNTLETILSRATVFYMDRYTPDEILEYSKNVFGMEKLDSGTRQKIIDLCETPGDVNILNKCGLYEFYGYVQLVVDNIAEVSLANAFKIPSKVALKEDAEGYDLRLFWKAVANVMLDKAKQNGNSKELVKYCDGYSVTSKYLQKLRIRGINKQMLIDCWVMEIRDIWTQVH